MPRSAIRTALLRNVRCRLLFATLALTPIMACNQDQLVGPLAWPDVELELRVGEHRHLPKLQLDVGFERVTSDSRCPTQVTCIWEGEATVHVWLLHARDDSVFVALSLRGGTPDASASVDTLGFRITALRLDPYPAEPEPIPENLYVLRLKIE